MAKVTVTPETFTMVFFDAERIRQVTEETADAVGLPSGFAVQVDIDEVSPLGRAVVESVVAPNGGAGSMTLKIEGGAFENAKQPRQLSEQAVVDSLARIFFRIKDRIDPAFGNPPADEELDLPHQSAWDAYAVGRAERVGLAAQKARRLYHFRNRHGFSDVADAVFERLWNGDGLTWADIDQACEETAKARAEV